MMKTIILILLPFLSIAQQSGKNVAIDGVPLVNGSPPMQVAKINLTAQQAAISASTLYTPPADGFYKINWVASVTKAATTSSTLGAFQVKYTNAADNVVKTWPPAAITNINSTTTNNTGTGVIGGCMTIYAKANTAIQYVMGYTSSGGQSMQYSLDIIIEKL